MSEKLHHAALELRVLAGIVTKLARRDLERRLDACGVDLGGLSFGVLRLLTHRAYTSSELSRQMMLTPATLVPAVDALERDGFVKRGQDPTDRRRAPLSLTRRGAEVLAQVPVVGGDDVLVKGLRKLSDAERQQLLRLLRALVREMAGEARQVGDILSALRAVPERSTPAAGQRLRRGA